MCGISGCFAPGGLDPARFYAAHSALRHRGPDDEGLVGGGDWRGKPGQFSAEGTRGRWTDLPDFREAGELRWVLGQHRLSILDLSEEGHGPMGSADGRLWLTYNGEVYNYRELREELAALGHEFRTGTDTEVVLHAFAEWGTGCFARFNGMWALALYDAEAGRLVLSRDRFGVKPLLYSLSSAGLLLGSEPKFFRGLMPLHVNERAAAEYLAEARVDHREETFHEEILQLPPGHFGVYDVERNALRLSRYWELPRDARRDAPLDDAISELTQLFDSAVDLRMRSDVPVGGLLSGGLDSTAIVRNLDHRGRLDSHGFHTFSAVYEEEAYSERRYVERAVAGRERLIPHYVTVGAEEVRDGLAAVIRAQDAPFRSVAVYCQHELYREVRASSPVVVLLNGQGADECFGGYTAHYHALLASHLMHGRLAGLARDASWVARHRGDPARRVLEHSAYRLWVALRSNGPVRRRTIEHPLLSRAFETGEPVQDRDPFENELRSNLLFSALPEYLRYEDRNSMASSLETRLPFLDYRLVEWAFTLPPPLKLARGETKRVVRRATAAYVPPEIVGRTDKMGFTSPQEVWQRGALEPWVREGVHHVNVSFADRDRLLAAYAAGNGCDPFFWFRAACLGWWQELLCS
jgi:asparagine synthase (glutamine-hydrolysing)